MTEPKKISDAVLCGFLNVLKPPGMTSAQLVGHVRRLLGGAKIGHAGTLDPEAAGVLPLMVGKAARLFDYLQDKEKAYITEVAFGCATDTQDAQGKVTETGESYPSEPTLRDALLALTGEQMQTPPMFSALKHDGKRLYDLARRGETLTLAPRPVTVHRLQLLAMTQRHGALLEVHCSKGFYVRTLCYDLGKRVGCPAHMRFLLRTQSGAFTLETANTLEQLTEASENGTLAELLLPMETVLWHMPSVEVPMTLQKALINGVPLPLDKLPTLAGEAEGKPIRVYVQGRLIGIGCRKAEKLMLQTWLDTAVAEKQDGPVSDM